MEEYFRAAILNIYQHGDTDIFPFPIENRILHDKISDSVSLLCKAHADFESYFSENSPDDIRSLVPVHHTGFRWANQLDPLWNAYFLGLTLSIARKVEDTRLEHSHVFSYRLDLEKYLSGTLFSTNISWRDFINRTKEISQNYSYVVICDIADCYSRISHHKLENCLQIIETDHSIRRAILHYLSYLSGTRSSGLPIGGPASRILSELAINNVDHLLYDQGIKFLRYADDYHILTSSKSQAYEHLFTLADALDNEGLALQKSKTRIVSKSEYDHITASLIGDETAHRSPIQKLMSLTLRYDPYAPNAEEKYEELKSQLYDIDIIGLLNEQLAQSRIHIASARRIVSALVALDAQAQYGAIVSILDNMDNLFPISANIFITIANIFENLSSSQKDEICDKIKDLYNNKHECMGIESNVAFAIRIVAKLKSIANQQWLTQCFENERSNLIRRDIILVFANWRNFPWLSAHRKHFDSASAWERRAFILASYSMGDEGKHWRAHTKKRFDDFELLMKSWASERVQSEGEYPL